MLAGAAEQPTLLTTDRARRMLRPVHVGRVPIVIATLAAVAPVAFGLPAPGLAVSPTADAFRADSVGDYLGQGVRWNLTNADASIAFVNTGLDSNWVTVAVETDDVRWRLGFAAPQGETLAVGHYPNAGAQTPLTSEIRFTRDGSGCNLQRGSFTIHEISFNGSGQPQSLALTFEHWCEPTSTVPLVGLLRVNSTTPMAVLSTPGADRSYGYVTQGDAAVPRAFTVDAFGDLPVTVTGVTVGGSHATDFPLSDDGCSGAILDPGETCSFEVGFTPGQTGERAAAFVIANSAPQGARTLPLWGYGRIPTTTSVVAIEPDWQWNRPGILVVGGIVPDPVDGLFQCVLDGVVIDGYRDISTGRWACAAPRELGSHVVRGQFVATNWHGGSTSSNVAFDVTDTTSLDLTASATTVAEGVPVTFSATVSNPANLIYPGGTLVLRNATTNTVLGSKAIDYGATTLTVTTSFQPGSHAIVATYDGVDGVLEGSSDGLTMTVKIDSVAPTATPPKHALAPGQTQTLAGWLRLRVAWSGTDNLSGVRHYEVQRQVDGGAWARLATVTSPSYTGTVGPGKTYRYRIRPVDHAGNIGAWQAGASFRLRRLDDDASSIDYVGSAWTKVYGDTPWSGGTARTSSTSGARVRLTFTGRSFGWLALKGPNRGRAAIYVNGSYLATVDLYAPTQQLWVLGWGKTWTTSATRTVEIRVLGTAGRPRIDVDAFWTGT